ncbi:uncharacterized protein LOC144326455 [Podarcis muralis]
MTALVEFQQSTHKLLLYFLYSSYYTLSLSSAQPGSSTSKRPNTRSQSMRSKKSTPSATVGGSASSSEEEEAQPQSEAPENAGQSPPAIEQQGGKRKAKKKHMSKTKKSKHSNTAEDTDFILGNHLSKRKRAKILNGDHIDIFTLLPPAKVLGKGEKKRTYGRRRYKTPLAERNFENWLDGFQVYMGVISVFYPKRSMHLVAYMAHVRRAFALPGEEAALTYEEDFCRNASLLPTTRWDLRDQNYWMEHVGPYMEKKPQDPQKSGKAELKKCRQCWEYSRGTCLRPTCKYLHECEKCLGNHPASACFKGKQPFRGGRGHFHQGNRGAPGPSQGATGSRY